MNLALQYHEKLTRRQGSTVTTSDWRIDASRHAPITPRRHHNLMLEAVLADDDQLAKVENLSEVKLTNYVPPYRRST
jgi:hypothetical protein